MLRCLICMNPITIERIFDIPCVWDDECNSGRPICNDCLLLLIALQKENTEIKVSWAENPNPCHREIRKTLGLDKKEPQRNLYDFMEV